MSADPLTQFADVLAATGRLVDGVREDQWALPTPCTEWDVRALVSHLVVGDRLFAGILTRQLTLADAPSLRTQHQVRDPAGPAYREAADAVLAAFRRPGALQEMFTVPFGTVPGVVALHLRITESLVHGWDLARATGQAVTVPADAAERELAFTRTALADVDPSRNPFRPEQPVAEGAPAIDRLAACLGRDVAAWAAPDPT